MTWFLLFALVGANPNTTQIQGPYSTRAECVRAEYFSERWCLYGCVQAGQLANAVGQLATLPPDINTKGAYCVNNPYDGEWHK